MSEPETDKKSAKNEVAEREPASAKSSVAVKEEEILKFWQENKIFEKSLEQTKGKKEFVFYDGPPFATGTPHYGHIVAGTMKDAIPRYQTMKGNFVRRRWGWDCHGLPVENLVEKDLGLKSKKDIEDYGIEKFNAKAREAVQEYVDDWKEIVPRLGRFVDMDNDYRTMDWYYTETVLQIFKRLYDQGLVYEGYKAMQICPRCETTLSNFEVNQGYSDVQDISVTVKFELLDEPNTYVLAWTTTPWTLPGNAALAVNPEIDYVKISLNEGENQGKFILAKSRLDSVLAGYQYEIVEELRGAKLIGRAYKPAFDYYLHDETIKNRDRGWKIYGAEFVTTEDGTGVVHIAPAFGEDDMNLGKKENLPFIQHVKMNGRFKPEVQEFADLLVKPKDDPQSTDVLVLKYLAANHLLFSKEKITHSYPHCWRCGTPLLNYATSSWFVEVTKIKDKLVAANQTINWVPAHVKDGRFGNWLEGARDWAISRTRFWGAPLPVWRCADCQKIKVIGSVEELEKNQVSKNNKFFLMRHGESENNLTDVIDCQLGGEFHLTELGRDQVQISAASLKNSGIDLIISSDFVRTKETAWLVADAIGYSKEKIIFDPRLREYNVGSANGGKWSDYNTRFASKKDKYHQPVEGGESCLSVRQRMGEVLTEMNQQYANKKILIVSHALPLFFMTVANRGLDERETLQTKGWGSSFQNAEVKEISFRMIPRNKNFELDLHRPYIDEVASVCDCGGEMKRVPDVFDCWFESGSMPYGQAHWPFQNRTIFDPEQKVGFPADFIAEGLDQTRGWFYSMLVLSTALFGQSSYRQVITNGLVLAEDGQKMSKSLHNYPDPMDLVNKYGADALRFYLLASPVTHAEDLNFSEKGVGEVYRKVIMKLSNVCAFYDLYRTTGTTTTDKTTNVLDLWILARLSETLTWVTEAMDNYELDRALRPLDEFVDDLSNWFVRRSRERFKSDDTQDKSWALATLKKVLNQLAVMLAPFTPFIAEDIYRRTDGPEESVHLDHWPETAAYNQALIVAMSQARSLVEIGLALRDQKNIKVRQPLAEFVVPVATALSAELKKIIADELNVKQVKEDNLDILAAADYEFSLESGDQKMAALKIVISPELKAEGDIRELIRNIQELRKQAGLVPTDQIKLQLTTDEIGRRLTEQFASEIKKAANILTWKIKLGNGDKRIGDSAYTFLLER